MADGMSEEKVHKSLVMGRELAGAINAWAAGAGVGFSEAVRRLCAQALAEWPDAAGAVVDEVRCVERRLLGELLRMSAALDRIESWHSDLLAALKRSAMTTRAQNGITPITATQTWKAMSSRTMTPRKASPNGAAASTRRSSTASSTSGGKRRRTSGTSP